MGYKIYLASSWRNDNQPAMLATLRGWGHEVYDFRNPRPGDKGFGWTSIDLQWENWDMDSYRAALRHPIAEQGYQNDYAALRNCDVVVLLLPSGPSRLRKNGFYRGMARSETVVGAVVRPEEG